MNLSGRGWQEVGRWVEAEKEKKKAVASVKTQPVTSLQRHQGTGEPLAAALPGLCGAATITIGFSD